jgi:hypothetical protein
MALDNQCFDHMRQIDSLESLNNIADRGVCLRSTHVTDRLPARDVIFADCYSV